MTTIRKLTSTRYQRVGKGQGLLIGADGVMTRAAPLGKISRRAQSRNRDLQAYRSNILQVSLPVQILLRVAQTTEYVRGLGLNPPWIIFRAQRPHLQCPPVIVTAASRREGLIDFAGDYIIDKAHFAAHAIFTHKLRTL